MTRIVRIRLRSLSGKMMTTMTTTTMISRRRWLSVYLLASLGSGVLLLRDLSGVGIGRLLAV